MRTTIRDVAKTLNLSHTTVSRVLNGRGADTIPEVTRERVVKAAETMNYRPSRIARALATGRTNTIALWVGDLFLPFYVPIIHHVVEQFQSHGYEVVTYKLNDDTLRSRAIDADGIIVVGQWQLVETALATVPHLPPVVGIGPYCSLQADYVTVDLRTPAREATLHLLEQGCQRVAYVVSSWANHAGDERYDGYTEAMQQWNRVPEYIPVESCDRPGTREVVRQRFEQGNSPDGLFCFSDDMALGAYRGLCDLKKRVPHEVALVGCDGIVDTEYLEVPLSTIALPFEEMCATAYRFLRCRIQEPDLPPQQVTLAPHLVVRPSSSRRSV